VTEAKTNFIGSVLESSPGKITIEIPDLGTFDNHKLSMQIGKYLLIENGNFDSILVCISSIKAQHKEDGENTEFRFLIDTQPVGTFRLSGKFERGAVCLPVPTEPAYLAEDNVLENIFSSISPGSFSLGYLSHSLSVKLNIDGDKFFSKHVTIVGSTGSGKSCAVASILHGAVGISDKKNYYNGGLRNSHIIIFDIHSEYAAAFFLNENENFTLNRLGVDTLLLPYWLMNAEELESMFVEVGENSSHNQISQFRHAVIQNKIRHNPDVDRIAFDTPVYFSLEEVCRYLDNINKEVINKLENEDKPKRFDGTFVDNRNLYFSEDVKFVQQSTANATKASNGPFYGDFDRLILRLRNKLRDPRLSFVLHPTKNGSPPCHLSILKEGC
jgi:uncharacterized protein